MCVTGFYSSITPTHNTNSIYPSLYSNLLYIVLSNSVSLTFIQYSFNIYSIISTNFFNLKLYFISVISLFYQFNTNYFTSTSFYSDYRTFIQFIVHFISILIHFFSFYIILFHLSLFFINLTLIILLVYNFIHIIEHLFRL